MKEEAIKNEKTGIVKVIAIWLPIETAEDLEEVRNKLRMSRSRYILDALEKELAKDMKKLAAHQISYSSY